MTNLKLVSSIVIIPFYNNHKLLNNLLQEIFIILPNTHIILINDGSFEDFVIKEKKYEAQISILKNSTNLGKGASLKKAINYVVENFNCNFVITMDADGQHSPKHLIQFVKNAEKNSQHLIIGKRDFKFGVMPFSRIISNTISSKLLSIKLKCQILDSQCGYRLIPQNMWSTALSCLENGFQFETEFIIAAAQSGKKIKFITIDTIYNGSTSSIKKINDTITFIKLYLKK